MGRKRGKSLSISLLHSHACDAQLPFASLRSLNPWGSDCRSRKIHYSQKSLCGFPKLVSSVSPTLNLILLVDWVENRRHLSSKEGKMKGCYQDNKDQRFEKLRLGTGGKKLLRTSSPVAGLIPCSEFTARKSILSCT